MIFAISLYCSSKIVARISLSQLNSTTFIGAATLTRSSYPSVYSISSKCQGQVEHHLGDTRMGVEGSDKTFGIPGVGVAKFESVFVLLFGLNPSTKLQFMHLYPYKRINYKSPIYLKHCHPDQADTTDANANVNAPNGFSLSCGHHAACNLLIPALK